MIMETLYHTTTDDYVFMEVTSNAIDDVGLTIYTNETEESVIYLSHTDAKKLIEDLQRRINPPTPKPKPPKCSKVFKVGMSVAGMKVKYLSRSSNKHFVKVEMPKGAVSQFEIHKHEGSEFFILLGRKFYADRFNVPEDK